MKRITLVISLICVAGLIGFLMTRAKTPPEVIKIYKAVPYEPKQKTTRQQEPSARPAETPQASEMKQADSSQTPDVQEADHSSEYELSPEEETALLEWLESLESPASNETPADATASGGEIEADSTEMSFAELSRRVREAYDLTEVIKNYFDPTSRHCPKCYQQNFEIMRNAKNGRFEGWACFNCNLVGGDVSDFVAWIEGIDVVEAARRLAIEAGILE